MCSAMGQQAMVIDAIQAGAKTLCKAFPAGESYKAVKALDQ